MKQFQISFNFKITEVQDQYNSTVPVEFSRTERIVPGHNPMDTLVKELGDALEKANKIKLEWKDEEEDKQTTIQKMKGDIPF